MDSDSESKLISLISELKRVHLTMYWDSDHEPDLDSVWELKIIPLIIQIISVVRSMDLDSQLKPESKLMSLVSQTVSLFNSTNVDSLPKPLSKLISFISQEVSMDSDQKRESDMNFRFTSQKTSSDSDQTPEFGLKLKLLVRQTLELKPDPELVSLIRQIVSVVVAISMECQTWELILLVPQVQVSFREGKFCVEPLRRSNTWECFIGDLKFISLTRDQYFTHFLCRNCKGEYHNEYEKAPVKIKHPLHQKHSLQLALNTSYEWGSKGGNRECYCCNEDLIQVFYFCSACDFSMNINCAQKAPDLYIPHSKWHEHPLALFPIKMFLTCDICALPTSNSPIYICPPCAFVVHLKCINLPRVIRISRHRHRICHTPSFEEGDWSCAVCRRKIDNDYGGYSCIKDDCSYAAHSRCATQNNVWDGIDLQGEPEEIEEEVAEPFVRISDGIIQHFTHDHHHLRLDENICRDYDENKLCQACITPIYFGNFYSCVQCEFVLHESCAHLSRKIYHPIHPHLLTLEMDHTKGKYYRSNECRPTSTLLFSPSQDDANGCSACHRFLTAGFFYDCGKEECDFRLHVQCATISEPFVHRSHVHPLFLTSKPEEMRKCSVCQRRGEPFDDVNETFNCIDECNDFALCLSCATLPQKLRYKHDKHILTLSYGEETDTVRYWCEVCERQINPEKGLYICDEYCCVTLHIECLIGKDLYMKPGSSFFYAAGYENAEQVGVQSNNHHMSRPFCSTCEKHSPHKIVFQCCGSIFCSLHCLYYFLYLN